MPTRDDWSRLFRSIAASRRDPSKPNPLEWGIGSSARGTHAFIAWHLPSSQPMIIPSPSTPEPTDAALWLACRQTDRDVDLILSSLDSIPRIDSDRGALIPQGLHRSIEVWTETELSSLHALTRLASLRNRPDWLNRALTIARWHIDNIQPDNATNRPWAVHLFALLAEDGLYEAKLHAETLIHNCQMSGNQYDNLSAAILMDAAEAIDSL